MCQATLQKDTKSPAAMEASGTTDQAAENMRSAITCVIGMGAFVTQDVVTKYGTTRLGLPLLQVLCLRSAGMTMILAVLAAPSCARRTWSPTLRDGGLLALRAALEAVVARVDLLFINDKEAELLSGEDNVVKAAQKIKEMGPSTVVIKRGEFGALMFSEDGIFAVPAMPLERVVDPTGAGDSFAGGFMGFLAASGRVDAEGIRRAAVAGSVTASFAVEDFSLDRLKALDKGQIAERYQAFRDLVRIPE